MAGRSLTPRKGKDSAGARDDFELALTEALARSFDARFGGIGGYLSEWTNFILGTIGSTIICTYVFNLTGGSVIAPILVHGASNTIKVNILRFTGDRTFEWQGFHVDITDLFQLPIVLAVLLLAGPELGRRRKHLASED